MSEADGEEHAAFEEEELESEPRRTRLGGADGNKAGQNAEAKVK